MRYSVISLFSIIVLTCPASFADFFNDGGVHNIDYTIERILEVPDNPEEDTIVIQEGGLIIDRGAPSAHTTVNLLDDGHILRGTVSIENQGCLNMYGGTVEWASVRVRNSGTFNMYNGSLDPWGVNVSDNAIANFYDGSISRLHLDHNGYAKVLGGEFFGLVHSFKNSKIDIYGGIFHGDFTGTRFSAVNNSTITLFGEFDLPYGIYKNTSGIGGSYQTHYVTGILANGQEITDLRCIAFPGASIALAPVPEPATITIFAFGGLALLRRKTKQ